MDVTGVLDVDDDVNDDVGDEVGDGDDDGDDNMRISSFSGKFGLTGYGFGQGAGTLLSVRKNNIFLNS